MFADFLLYSTIPMNQQRYPISKGYEIATVWISVNVKREVELTVFEHFDWVNMNSLQTEIAGPRNKPIRTREFDRYTHGGFPELRKARFHQKVILLCLRIDLSFRSFEVDLDLSAVHQPPYHPIVRIIYPIFNLS